MQELSDLQKLVLNLLSIGTQNPRYLKDLTFVGQKAIEDPEVIKWGEECSAWIEEVKDKRYNGINSYDWGRLVPRWPNGLVVGLNVSGHAAILHSFPPKHLQYKIRRWERQMEKKNGNV